MRSVNVLLTLVSAVTIGAEQTNLLRDLNKISRYWGHLSPYKENPDDLYGVQYTGLPTGCQIENVQVLQRHADRFSINWVGDSDRNVNFGRKVIKFNSANHTDDSFTGPLSFLNSWSPIDSNTGLLTGLGASSMFAAGVNFWNQYGRTLYNASAGQLAYDPNFPNGTARPPVVLRTTDQSRVHNSQINWALGFFGSTNEKVPNPSFANVTKPFKVVIIPEGGSKKQNNTLASYDSCFNDFKQNIGNIGEILVPGYIKLYLGPAAKRLQAFAPADFTLTLDDVYAMQSLCAYEHEFIGNSDFCGFFTEDEWAGFENTLDITCRAQGIGYVQEVLARLNHSQMSTSSSSVNATLNQNPETFPIDQAFYADFSHNDILISALTAMSVDYLHAPPNLNQFPPNPDRKFILSQLTPFGARLVTETIGCSSPNPIPGKNSRVQYSPSQYGYDASTSSYIFIRIRLNNGIILLSTIRGGACANETTGRVDGICALDAFMLSQQSTTALANYQYACFSNYSVEDPRSGKDWDGSVYA